MNKTVTDFCLVTHLKFQAEWSARTFGPGERTAGVLDHIRKELAEIEAKPTDLTEWIDVIILALDGAWRSGHSPEQIVTALIAKQAKNESRVWPDWRTAEPGKAIEHVRDTTRSVLSPCPFCGADVATAIVYEDSVGPDFEFIGSIKGWVVVCDATAPILEKGCGASTGWHATEEDAITAWNKRSGGKKL